MISDLVGVSLLYSRGWPENDYLELPWLYHFLSISVSICFDLHYWNWNVLWRIETFLWEFPIITFWIHWKRKIHFWSRNFYLQFWLQHSFQKDNYSLLLQSLNLFMADVHQFFQVLVYQLFSFKFSFICFLSFPLLRLVPPFYLSSFFSLDRCSIPSSEVSILWSYLDITLLFSSYVYLISLLMALAWRGRSLSEREILERRCYVLEFHYLCCVYCVKYYVLYIILFSWDLSFRLLFIWKLHQIHFVFLLIVLGY